jgi:hypothetical protein
MNNTAQEAGVSYKAGVIRVFGPCHEARGQRLALQCWSVVLNCQLPHVGVHGDGLPPGSLSSSTRPTLNRRTGSTHLYEHSPCWQVML